MSLCHEDKQNIWHTERGSYRACSTGLGNAARRRRTLRRFCRWRPFQRRRSRSAIFPRSRFRFGACLPRQCSIFRRRNCRQNQQRASILSRPLYGRRYQVAIFACGRLSFHASDCCQKLDRAQPARRVGATERARLECASSDRRSSGESVELKSCAQPGCA